MLSLAVTRRNSYHRDAPLSTCRVLVQHARGLRAAQLCSSVLYAAVMSYAYLILSPSSLTSSQIVGKRKSSHQRFFAHIDAAGALRAAGLLLSYLYVTTTGWCMTIGLVPYFEKTLLEFNPVVSTVSVGSLALFTHFTGSTGLATYGCFMDKALAYVSFLQVLARPQAQGHSRRIPHPIPVFLLVPCTQNVLWVLEDCPLLAYLPLHLVMMLMHAAGHLCMDSAWPLPFMALGYLGLGAQLMRRAPNEPHALAEHATRKVWAMLVFGQDMGW